MMMQHGERDPRRQVRLHEASHYQPERMSIGFFSFNHFDAPSKQGWLTKQGGRVKNWKRRWFVLRDSRLYYYKQPTDLRPLGFIPLSRCSIRILRYAHNKKAKQKFKYCFELYDPVRVFSTRHPTFHIFAEDKEQMEQWVEALNLKTPEELCSRIDGALVDSHPIEKEGWLTKRGGIVKNWKRRWFILQGNLIYYFKSDKHLVAPLGFIPVDRCSIHVLSTEDELKSRKITLPKKRQKHIFEITDPCSAFNKWHQSYFIMASNEDEMDQWISAICSVTYQRIANLDADVISSDTPTGSTISRSAADEFVVLLSDGVTPEWLAGTYSVTVQPLENSGALGSDAYLIIRTPSSPKNLIALLAGLKGVNVTGRPNSSADNTNSGSLIFREKTNTRSFTLNLSDEEWDGDEYTDPYQNTPMHTPRRNGSAIKGRRSLQRSPIVRKDRQSKAKSLKGDDEITQSIEAHPSGPDVAPVKWGQRPNQQLRGLPEEQLEPPKNASESVPTWLLDDSKVEVVGFWERGQMLPFAASNEDIDFDHTLMANAFESVEEASSRKAFPPIAELASSPDLGTFQGSDSCRYLLIVLMINWLDEVVDPGLPVLFPPNMQDLPWFSSAQAWLHQASGAPLTDDAIPRMLASITPRPPPEACPRLVAALIVKSVQELPFPILPYHDFSVLSKLHAAVRLDELQKLVQQLGHTERLLLQALLALLGRLNEVCGTAISVLVEVFSRSLLRPPLQTSQNWDAICEVFRLMLVDFDALFL